MLFSAISIPLFYDAYRRDAKEDLFRVPNNFFCMLLRHLTSIIFLPVMVMLVIPLVLISLFQFSPFWGSHPLTQLLLLIVLLFVGAGLILLYFTISLFIKKGDGTIAPWNPTNKLVVEGVYGHVRNPMIIGVFMVLTGETIVLGSVPVTAWTIFFILANLIYIPLIEEPKLAERFGKEYSVYRENVPRWIPRLSCWKKDGGMSENLDTFMN